MALQGRTANIEDQRAATKLAASELLFDAPKIPGQLIKRSPELSSFQDELDRHWYDLRTVLLRGSEETTDQVQNVTTELDTANDSLTEIQNLIDQFNATFQSLINNIASGDVLQQYDWDSNNLLHHFLAPIKLNGLIPGRFLTVDATGIIISSPDEVYTKTEVDNLLDQELNIQPQLIELNFNDNVTQIVTLGDKTVYSIIKIRYTMAKGSDFVTGTFDFSHDGTNICPDDERHRVANDISTVDFLATFVGNDMRLSLVGTGPGDPVTFKYAITQKIII